MSRHLTSHLWFLGVPTLVVLTVVFAGPGNIVHNNFNLALAAATRTIGKDFQDTESNNHKESKNIDQLYYIKIKDICSSKTIKKVKR